MSTWIQKSITDCQCLVLGKNFWYRRGLSVSAPSWRSTSLWSLPYGCGQWTIYRRHARKLDNFHMSCLRKLLYIKWQEKCPTLKFLSKPACSMLLRGQARWVDMLWGCLITDFPNKSSMGSCGTASAQLENRKKRYIDSMKATFKNSILMLTHVRSKPKDRLTWHQTLYDGHLTGSGSRWQKKQEFTEKIQHQGTHKLFPVHGVVNSANQKPVWGVTSDRTNPNKPSSEEAFS